MAPLSSTFTSSLTDITTWQEQLFEQLHRAPELSMQEERTRAEIRQRLTDDGYEVHDIGGGVVGVLSHGEGPTVLLRADIDALPVKELADLPYASTATQVDRNGQERPVMHACGHDFHTTAALGVAAALAAHREEWSGTYIALFQPGEETAEGARSMVEDGLAERIPAPDVALAQHILTTPSAGKVSVAAGPILSTAASMRITIHGAGSHGSMPHLGVDPIVIAGAVITRIQSIVAREIAPGEFGVVTVGSVKAGAQANIIPDDAELLVNFRAYSTEVLERLQEAVRRITTGEARAAGAPQEPEFEVYDRFPLTTNNADIAASVRAALIDQLGEDRVEQMTPITASEDFSTIPDAFGTPYCYWGVGGYAEGRRTYPNHSPHWSPDKQPTLSVATEAALAVVVAHLG